MKNYKIEDHYPMNTIQKLGHHNATRYNGDIEDWVEIDTMFDE